MYVTDSTQNRKIKIKLIAKTCYIRKYGTLKFNIKFIINRQEEEVNM